MATIKDIDNGWICTTCGRVMKNYEDQIRCGYCGLCFVKPSVGGGGNEVEALEKRVRDLEQKISEGDLEVKRLASSVCDLTVLLANFMKPKSDKRVGETVFCQKCGTNTHHYIPGMVCSQCSIESS